MFKYNFIIIFIVIAYTKCNEINKNNNNNGSLTETAFNKTNVKPGMVLVNLKPIIDDENYWIIINKIIINKKNVYPPMDNITCGKYTINLMEGNIFRVYLYKCYPFNSLILGINFIETKEYMKYEFKYYGNKSVDDYSGFYNEMDLFRAKDEYFFAFKNHVSILLFIKYGYLPDDAILRSHYIDKAFLEYIYNKHITCFRECSIKKNIDNLLQIDMENSIHFNYQKDSNNTNTNDKNNNCKLNMLCNTFICYVILFLLLTPITIVSIIYCFVKTKSTI